MKCLQISKFYPPVNGGIETTVKDISEGLTARGWQVDVVCANTSHLTSLDMIRSVQVMRISSLGVVASTSISPALIYELFKLRSKYDVYHVHLPNPMANLALFCVRPSSKIVLHWHSDVVKQTTLMKIYAPLQSWLLRRADVIISTTDAYAKSSPWLKPHLNKVRSIPSCINDPRESEDLEANKIRANIIRKEFGGKHIIFSLGRLIYYKGFDVLIKSLSLLDDDVTVLLGGTGELMDSLKGLAESIGVKHKIVFLGRVADDELAAYYLSCDLFCLPSVMRSEAFGLVMVEAMSFGKPVVATRILGSGVTWVNRHGETGLNARPGDYRDLAYCLKTLLSDQDLRKKMGEVARKRFEENFTTTEMIDATIKAYTKSY